MTSDEFENRKAALLAEHTRLMNAGFPQERTAQFWKKVDELPDHHGEELRHLAEISLALKEGRVTRSR